MTFDARERSAYLGAPVELYRFACGSSVWTQTSGDRPQAYAGATYEPQSIARGEIDQNGEDEQGQMEITLARENPVAELFIADLPSHPVTVQVFRFHRGDAEVLCTFTGEVASAEFARSKVRLSCLPASQAFRRRIPTLTFQSQCNWALFSAACGLAKDDYRVTGAVAAVSGSSIEVGGVAGRPDGYFTAGWVETTDGEAHWITGHSGAVLSLMTPFRDLHMGDTVHVYPGCDRTLAACKAFGNQVHFCGFPFIPTKNPFIVGIR